MFRYLIIENVFVSLCPLLYYLSNQTQIPGFCNFCVTMYVLSFMFGFVFLPFQLLSDNFRIADNFYFHRTFYRLFRILWLNLRLVFVFVILNVSI